MLKKTRVCEDSTTVAYVYHRLRDCGVLNNTGDECVCSGGEGSMVRFAIFHFNLVLPEATLRTVCT